MKTKSILKATIILCGIMLIWSLPAIGQEWTAEQKEVWSVLEKRWEKMQEGNYGFIINGIHEDALMWMHDKNTPFNKPTVTSVYERWIYWARPVKYEIKPYSIQVFGDIANVMYAYKWEAEKKWSGHSRTLITFKKENGKWLIISSLGASCVEPLFCLDWDK